MTLQYHTFFLNSRTKSNPDNCIFLVDTYDTLRSGIPNAIRVANEFLTPNGYKLKGITLDEAYKNLGKTYGNYKSKLYNIYFKGSEGQEEMKKIMEELEENPITELNGNKVKYVENYFKLTRKDLDTGKVENIPNLPIGDLIKFIFEDGSNISVRPSGTEPKCKVYVEMVDASLDVAGTRCDEAYASLKKILNIK